MERDTLIRRNRFSDNVEVSPWVYFCCRDYYNYLVCFTWWNGGSVTISQ